MLGRLVNGPIVIAPDASSGPWNGNTPISLASSGSVMLMPKNQPPSAGLNVTGRKYWPFGGPPQMLSWSEPAPLGDVQTSWNADLENVRTVPSGTLAVLKLHCPLL